MHGSNTRSSPHGFETTTVGSTRGFRVSDLPQLNPGRRVRVAGGVIVRQRPPTARGFLFISLEDETGIANIVVRPKLFEVERAMLVSQSFLLVEGILQNQDGIISVRAERFWPIEGLKTLPSHDFC